MDHNGTHLVLRRHKETEASWEQRHIGTTPDTNTFKAFVPHLQHLEKCLIPESEKLSYRAIDRDGIHLVLKDTRRRKHRGTRTYGDHPRHSHVLSRHIRTFIYNTSRNVSSPEIDLYGPRRNSSGINTQRDRDSLEQGHTDTIPGKDTFKASVPHL